MKRQIAEELEREGGLVGELIQRKDKPMIADRFRCFIQWFKVCSHSDKYATEAYKHYFYSWCFSVGIPTELAIEVWQEEISENAGESESS